MNNYLGKLKLTALSCSLIVLLVFVPMSVYGAAWYDNDWTYAKKITINSTLVNGTHSNFPIVVNVTDIDFIKTTNDQGLDILFTTFDNETKLNHEIEHFNNVTGWLTAWVSIPTITDVSDTDIFIYYGDTGSNGNQNNTAAVWSDYHLVIHMGDDLTDSSGNNDPATNGGTTIRDNIGSLGKARSFDGINDFINITDSYLDFNLDSDKIWSASLWMFPNDTNAGIDKMWNKHAGTGLNKGIYTDYRTGFGDTRYCYNTDNVTTLCHNGIDEWRPVFENNFHLEILTWFDEGGTPNRNDFSQWRNGTCSSVTPYPPCAGAGSVFGGDQFYNTSSNVIIGSNNDGSADHWDGYIDEFRIANFEILEDWHDTEYNNQQPHTTNQFLIYGSEGENPNLEYDTIFLRIADQYRNHIGMITNTDTTTDLDGVNVTVPFSSPNVIFMDSSFNIKDEGIECNYNGRVKVTGSIYTVWDSGGIRPNQELQVLINGVEQNVKGASGYIRVASGHNEASLHVTVVGNCVVDHVIELQTNQISAAAVVLMTEGSSMLLVERI